jgi:hypothetical protein
MYGAWDLYECLNILTNQDKQPVYLLSKEKAKEYYQKNKEHIKQYAIKYNEENKEKVKKYSKTYYEKHKERLKQEMADRMKQYAEYEKTWERSTLNNYNYNHLLRISMDLFQ